MQGAHATAYAEASPPTKPSASTPGYGYIGAPGTYITKIITGPQAQLLAYVFGAAPQTKSFAQQNVG